MGFYFYQENLTHTVYDAEIQARRDSEAMGPVVTWDAALPLLSGGDWGSVDLAWTIGGGVLFGDRKVEISGSGDTNYFEVTPFEVANRDVISTLPNPLVTTLLPAVGVQRSSEATVPTFNASLGVSYNAGAFSIGAGYRWERYIDAIDGGFAEEKSEDRTIDGPYFKLSLGFGG